MCGVAAALGPNALAQVQTMVGKLAHRGVRHRIEYGAGWAVGHVRLPVVGVGEYWDQPVKRGQWVLGWVGEVLNFRERNPGMVCDTELVLDTWSKGLHEGFREFDGFWSVLAYDIGNGRLYGLTDYLAQKTLYIRGDEYATAVASEPDAVAALGPVTLDPLYLGAVAKWGYSSDTRRTPYNEVNRLKPGERVLIRGAGSEPEYTCVDRIRGVNRSLSGLKKEIEAAVRRRVQSSDVPVSALVSGGLDSGITYTLARRYGEVKAYYVDNGEWGECLQVAPDATPVGLGQVNDRKALDYIQEPLDLGSLLPQVALSDAARGAGDEVVCLTGDGADELFGGYSRSLRYDSQASDVWHELVGWHLPRLDRVMMRNRLEVRSPFLARRVVEAALALPWEERKDKKILRDLFRGDLPPGVADRPKKALRTPECEADREGRTVRLVELFKNRVEEMNSCHQ